ncbi:disease resistance protein RPM1-like [Cornus florida]|uniref:disease resistance protein RPM1-like n=1 Tax=Cornus florida TaxID=4283 RepID=UPI0028973708|nr:disease resistance protein RPM1-like [Cornus florida]
MGKIKKVYDNIEVKNHFKSHAWITVSQSFDLKDLIQQLFNEVKKLAPQILESMDNNNLKAQLKDFLQPRSFRLSAELNSPDSNMFLLYSKVIGIPSTQRLTDKIQERMAKNAVTFLLNHLTIFLQQELKLLGGIREDAEGHQRYRYKFNISEHSSSSNTVNITWYDHRGDALLLEEAELVAIDGPKKQLIGWLMKDTLILKVVSVAQLKDFLQQRRYVIVLDDVWSINAWDALKYALPDNNYGSRILLITRIGSVASTSSVESHGNIHAVKALSPKESWILFCWKTFQEKYCPPHLEELSQSILEKCVGLPLAIVAISGVLATKDKNRMDEWEMAMRSLGAELEGRDKLEKDYHIKIMKLIRLWTAEGFVEAKEGMTSEEVAEGYLNELVNRSLVQVAMICYDGRLRRSCIHDLFREIIISKSIEQSIAAIVSEENTRWPEKVRRLSIHYTLGNLQQTNHFSQLRLLLMFKVAEPLSKSSMPILFNGGLMLLKVLDLRGASLETVPNEVAKLFHLRYLSLKRTDVVGDMAQLLAPLQKVSNVAPMFTCQIHHVKGTCEHMMTTDGA